MNDESPKMTMKFDWPPQYVGRYCIGGKTGVCVAFTSKPSWWHRFWMKVCLGIEWFDDV